MKFSFPALILPWLLFFLFSSQPVFGGGVVVEGELKKWHTVTLLVTGNSETETGSTNPFADYRLNVTFTKGSRSFTVPGYFAADGDAANTSATSGEVWKVHFTPDETGLWSYEVSFRYGTLVAVSDNPTAGSAVGPDGTSGSFTIAANDKVVPDFRAKGRLSYVGEHYLQFEETGEYFIKGGADAPENLLAYYGFDNTRDYGGAGSDLDGTSSFVSQGVTYSYHGDGLHHYEPHFGDWQTGDPDWGGGKGKNIIGALNYLASKGMNSISFLTNNVMGDGMEVFPYVTYNDLASPQSDRLRFDCSKLDQWNIVFTHAQTLGLYLHVKTQETENDQLLDGGELGNERKLYYRELIARFGHHLALNWNLGEENDIWSELSDPNNDYVKSYAQYFYDHDPYRHHVVIHTYPGQQANVYTPLLGSASKLTGTSIQIGYNVVHEETVEWVGKSGISGTKWVVANDEQGSANAGVKPSGSGNNHDDIRKFTLWGNLMAGGAGVEYYFGYSFAHADLDCEDWRSRETMWDFTAHALDFWSTLPFQEMTNADELVGNPSHGNTRYCFAKPGEFYLVYLPSGGTHTLDLTGYPGNFQLQWFDPRNGGGLQDGEVTDIAGDASVSLGAPPSSPTSDWLAVVVLDGSSVFPVEWGNFEANPLGQDVQLSWSTLSERSSFNFGVQRSADGSVWEEIGSVMAAGYSSTPQSYTYIDANPGLGRWYYQLRQMDVDGAIHFSDRVEVWLDESALRMSTRVEDGMLKVNWSGLEAGSATLELRSLQGQLVCVTSVSGVQGNLELQPPNIASGHYLALLRTKDQQAITRIIWP
jgi:hypothetical protein